MLKKDNKYILVALLVTAMVFGNTLSNDFVNWDDPANFLIHPVIASSAGLWISLKAIFTTTVLGNYNPLSTSSFLIDKALFGFENPWGWHMINVLLHMVNVVLVYRISKKLGLGIIAAFVVSLLFGIHPMRVESVAWVTERKDVLFSLFYLLAILQYLKYKSTNNSRHIVWLIVFFTLSLLSKIQAVSLPLSLLAIDFFRSGKWQFRDWISKWYLFGMSLVIGVIGLLFLKEESSLLTDYNGSSFYENIVLAGYSLLVYLYKLVVPFPLSAYYQHPDFLEPRHYLGVLALIGLPIALWRSYKNENKLMFFGLFFFLANVFFVLQWVKAGQGYLADRFTYIPYLGLFLIIGGYIDKSIKENTFSSMKKYGLVVIGLVFCGLTILQNSVWANGETLWSKSIEVNPKSARSYAARGNYFARKGLGTNALQDYNKSLTIKEIPEVKENRAKLLMMNSRDENDSRQALKDLLSFEDKTAEQYINIGALYVMLSENPDALKYYQEGMQKYPEESKLPLNSGRVLQAMSKFEEALFDFEKSIQLNPSHYEAYFEKGRLLRNLQKLNESLPYLNKAIELSPTFCTSFYERSMLYANANQLEQARLDLKKAIELNCEDIDENYKQQLGL